MKKHILISLLLLLLLPLGALARPRSVAEAKAAIEGARHIKGKAATTLAFTAPDSLRAGAALLYVFNHGTDGGFTVVAGDDRVEAVLGYTDKGSFHSGNMAPALEWWLQQYARQMQLLSAVPEGGNIKAAASARSTIEPLVQTQWNQSAPYNDLCPVKNGSRSVTGCVATAFAQVLAYHKYFNPRPGVGVVTSKMDGTSFNFDTAFFEWNIMLNNYDKGQYTSAQGRAVAKLMLACGVSVNMNYSPEGSGAYTDFFVPYALTEYFGYDKGVRVMERNCTFTADWTDAIYKELAAGRPVIYSGYGDGGGHCFVCDGYQSYSNLDYFHFNWGWAGAGDGWFRLSGLDPITLGIGGGTGGGFSYGQSIVIGIQPPVNGSGYDRYARGLIDPDYGANILENKYLALAAHLFSYYPTTLSYKLGYRITGNSPANASMSPVMAYDPETTSVEGCKAEGAYGYNGSAYAVDLDALKLTKGSYRLTPMICIENEDWKPMPQELDNYACVDLEVQGTGKYSSTLQKYIYGNRMQAQFLASEKVAITPGDSISLDVVFENKAARDFENDIYLLAFDSSSDINNLNNLLFYNKAKFLIEGNGTHQATLGIRIPAELEPGQYRFVIFQPQLKGYQDYYYEAISTPLEWTAKDPNAPNGIMETKFVSSDVYENESFKIELLNGTDTAFNQKLYMAMLRKLGDNYQGYYFILGEASINPGELLTIPLQMSSTDFIASGQYTIYLAYPTDKGVEDISGTYEVNFHSLDTASGLHMGLSADGSYAIISKASVPVTFDGSHHRLPSSFTAKFPTDWNNGPITSTLTLPVKEMRREAFQGYPITDIHIPDGFAAPLKLDLATKTRRFWLEGTAINVSNAQAFPNALCGVDIFVPSGAYKKYYSLLKAVKIAPADTIAAHIFETASIYRLQPQSNDIPSVDKAYPLAIVTDTPIPFRYHPDVDIVCTEPSRASVEIDSNPWDRNVGIRVNVTPHAYGDITLRITPRQYGAASSQFTFNVPDLSGTESIELTPDTEIYNLHGQRVYGTPTPGLYLIRQGATVRKGWL